jgi:hypothetical protein
MKTKVLTMVMVMTFLLGVAAAPAVLPTTPGYDSVMLFGSASGSGTLTDFRRITKSGVLGANPYVIPAGKVLMITELSVVDNTSSNVLVTLRDITVLKVDVSSNKNFNMTTGFMVSVMTALEVTMNGTPSVIIMRGYLMPKPVP